MTDLTRILKIQEPWSTESSTTNYFILTTFLSINKPQFKATKSQDPGLLLIRRETNFWLEKTTLSLSLPPLLIIKKPPPAKLTSLTKLLLMLKIPSIKLLEMTTLLTKLLMKLPKNSTFIHNFLDLTLSTSRTRTQKKMVQKKKKKIWN